VVLASDTHPNLISNFTPQLQSRFVAGMVVKLDSPDVETRLAILKAKAAAIKLAVPQDVLEYIANHIRSSVRELEGSLIKLAAVSSLEKSPVTLDLARNILADYLARTDSVITLGDIESVVSAYFGVTAADLHSSRRTQTVSLARMVAMYLARSQTAMSFPEIGQAMGKNHSSVVLATQRMEKALAANTPLKWNTPTGKKSLPACDLIELIRNQIN
jgi:chromosomal replication initiator protein